jgi:hypothetical protein
VKLLSDVLAAKKAGDRVKLKVGDRELEAVLVLPQQWTYAIRPVPSPTPEQRALGDGWLGQ